MINWLNFFVMIMASMLFFLYYVRSVSPAGREKISGETAYKACYHDRIVSMIWGIVVMINFVLYHFYPIETPLPLYFPWPWWVSLIIALTIGVPAGILMIKGEKDAGEETLRPKKEHTMYGGIYQKIRHPQATGEVLLFPVITILLHSPFLTIFSLIYFPIFIMLCYSEEQDLLLRYGDDYAEYCRTTGAFWPKRKKTHA